MVRFLPKRELKPGAHELHGWSWQGALSCPLSNIPHSFPSAPDPSCQPSPRPLRRTSRVRLYPPLHYPLPGREVTSFPFSFCPSILPPIQKVLLETGGSSTNSCLSIWIMGSCLRSPRSKRRHFQDIISNDMAFQGDVSAFSLSPTTFSD